MTPSTLTFARPAAEPRTDTLRPGTASSVIALMKARSAASPTSEAADPTKAAATSLKETQKQRRQSLKDQAKAQVMALVQRIRTLKQFASENPQVMAKQLAAIVKELKSALKAYADAGGTPKGMGTDATVQTAPSRAAGPVDKPSDAASSGPDDTEAETAADRTADAGPAGARELDPNPPAAVAEADPRNVYEKMRDSVSGSEAASDMDFVKLVRGVGKVIRDLLTKAKIQTALKGPDDETKKAFEATEAGLRDVDEALDRMDRDIRNSSPAAGMFVALYA